MELYPAIDIRSAQVVRSSRSDPSDRTLYHPDPFAVAEAFLQAGASWLHVVDLDRAFGVGDQTALVAALVKRLPIPVQVVGGVRSLEAVEMLRDVGVQRVLLDAPVAADPAHLTGIADQFASDCLGLALDVNEGRVWARQWEDTQRHSPEQLAACAAAAGLSVLVYTDLAREGALGGAAVDAAVALGRSCGLDVIVSGGVNGLDDLVRARDAGLAGAIVGRALFERRFTLEEALACCSSRS